MAFLARRTLRVVGVSDFCRAKIVSNHGEVNVQK